MLPYIPVIAPAETSTERIYEPETVDILEDPTENTTDETTAEIDPDAPAPETETTTETVAAAGQ